VQNRPAAWLLLVLAVLGLAAVLPTCGGVEPEVTYEPPQSHIAYVSGDRNIWVMNSDGSNPRQLTSDGASRYPRWSPDGTRIAFEAGTGIGLDIHVMNADGTNRRNLTNLPGDEALPTWSPDGTKIAFERFWVRRDSLEVQSGIYVMNSDGSGISPLPNTEAGDISPSWSSDGTKIAFVTSKRSWVMNADGSNRRPLSSEILPPTFGAEWSPDDTKIAFGSIPPMGFSYSDVYVVNSDGTALSRLTDTENNSSPTWSPDGTRIAFTSSRDGGAEIYVMNSDGSTQTRLTYNAEGLGGPAWQPVP